MISLQPTADQTVIVDSVGAFLDDALPLSRLHRDKSERDEAAIWGEMAELGWFALGLPEAEGGIGADMPTMALVFRRLGRNLVSPSVLATLLAARLAAESGLAGIAAGLAEGRERAAFAIAAPGGTEAAFLIDGRGAGFALGWHGGELALYPASAVSTRADALSMDAALLLERFNITRASAMARSGALDAEAGLLAAALMTGLAETARDMAVAYARTREQFGRPIGSFQAVKHRCADMAVAAEVAWAQTVFASLHLAAGRPEAAAGAQAAQLLAADAAIANAEANVQVHGGIGFTDEADPHLLVRRAQLLARLGSDRRRLRQVLADAPVGDAA